MIIILCSIFVFTSISFSKGIFDFHFVNNSSILDSEEDEANKDLNMSQIVDIETSSSMVEENLNTKDIDKINSLDDDLMKEDQEIINQEINKKEGLIKENQSNKDIKIIQNKQPKSNFI